MFEITVAQEIEQRAVEIKRAGIARDQDADRQPIEKPRRVAPDGLVNSLAFAFGKRRRRRGRKERLALIVRLTDLSVVAQSLRAADQRPRDFPEGVSLTPTEFHAVAASLRRLARGERLKRRRPYGNDF